MGQSVEVCGSQSSHKTEACKRSSEALELLRNEDVRVILVGLDNYEDGLQE